MAKKSTYKFDATVALNNVKGGGWLSVITVMDGEGIVTAHYTQAWKNASAAKKHVKEMVKELTPRKSVKMIAGDAVDAKGKPAIFTGELTYKA